jgi:hypothetical protein
MAPAGYPLALTIRLGAAGDQWIYHFGPDVPFESNDTGFNCVVIKQLNSGDLRLRSECRAVPDADLL